MSLCVSVCILVYFGKMNAKKYQNGADKGARGVVLSMLFFAKWILASQGAHPVFFI